MPPSNRGQRIPEDPPTLSAILLDLRQAWRDGSMDDWRKGNIRLQKIFLTDDPSAFQQCLDGPPVNLTLLDMIELLKFARTTDTPTLRLAVLYSLALCQVKVIMESTVRADGKEVSLHRQDFAVCIDAQEHLKVNCQRALLEPFTAPKCGSQHCAKWLSVKVPKVIDTREMAPCSLQTASEVQTRMKYVDSQCEKDIICAVCAEYVKRKMRECQLALWRKLPRFFGMHNQFSPYTAATRFW